MTSLPPPEEPRPRGLIKSMSAGIGEMTPLQQVLWAIAAILAVAALVIFIPTVISGPSASARTIAPTRVAQTAPTRLSTLTPVPSATPTFTPSPMPTLEPLVIPTPPPDGAVLTFVPNPDRTGWLGSNELGPHWRDRNLHSGFYQGQALIGLVQFDLTSLAPGSRILYAALELTGRNARSLGKAGAWQVDLIDSAVAKWEEASYDDVRKPAALATLGSGLSSTNIAVGLTNRFVFSAEQLKVLQKQVDIGTVHLRLSGPAEGGDNLFTWDAGPGPTEPVLTIVAVPATFSVITATPTPPSLFAAATLSAQQTVQARQYGTPTPLSRGYVTATPAPTTSGYVVVTPVPAPLNQLTATAQAVYATAVAFTTGTFTPTPPNVITVTPTPSFLGLSQFTPIPSPSPTRAEVSLLEYRKTPIPAASGLIGKIAFYSNREAGTAQIYVMDRNGNITGKLMGDEYYRIAAIHDLYSQDWLFHLDVGTDARGLWQITMFDVAKGFLLPLIQESPNARGMGIYHPAWSPDGSQIAFVSERTGFSEIYVYDVRTQITKRLTTTETNPRWGYPPYNKHPSWSPDGKEIIFGTNRGSDDPNRSQIWIMNADGGGMRSLSPSPYNDWDAVWIKR